MKKYFLYCVAAHRNGALHFGVTSNLVHRIWQHRAGQIPGCPGASLLVWYEDHLDLRSTLRRQLQILRAALDWQLRLVEQANPLWCDLYDDLLSPRRELSAEAA